MHKDADMDAFIEASKVEAEAEQQWLEPVIKLLYPNNWRKITTVREQALGDYECNGEYWELKAEEDHTGNLFIETDSNRRTGRAGWFYTATAPWLPYSFHRQGIAYFIDFGKLREWGNAPLRAWQAKVFNARNRLETYDERRQNKREQANDTWGRIVPIANLQKLLGPNHFLTLDLTLGIPMNVDKIRTWLTSR